MKIYLTSLPDLVLIEPTVYHDSRGNFYESFNEQEFSKYVEKDVRFVQDNHSTSGYGVLRGLHYQIEHPQGKLVRVTKGVAWDVAVDMREGSPTFGRWHAQELTDINQLSMWVPPGFAHGFLALSEKVEMQYKVTDYRHPEHERVLLWNDETINIPWPMLNASCKKRVLSDRDLKGTRWQDAEKFKE